MSGNQVTHSEVERLLNDRDNIILLHTLGGEIWGASLAATDIFGYSNEEMRQMCLVNIRPKALRLSDVCKDKMGDDAVVVFQKRNNRRFTASVKRSVISFVHQREPLELVCLHLYLGESANTSKPKVPHIDINELAQFVASLKEECQQTIRDFSRDIKALVATELTAEQQKIAERMSGTRSKLTHISDNIIDSFQLAQNALNLDSEPFNIVEFLSTEVPHLHASIDTQKTLVLSPNVPELIYGDKKIVEKIFRNILSQVNNHFKPKHALLTADYELSGEKGNRLAIRYLFEGCTSLSVNQDREEFSCSFLNSMPIVFTKHLLRLMDGILRFSYQGDTKFELNFEFSLPEVHDLGLTRKIDFLKGKSVVLVDAAYSALATQLKFWGAQLEQFNSIAKATDYLQTGKQSAALLLVHGDVPNTIALETIEAHKTRLVLIGVRNISAKLKTIAVALPLKCSIPNLGNVLSQVLLEEFPYPYYNINSKRSHSGICHLGQLLVVSHDIQLRAQLVALLRDINMSVDEAINGIDAVMASSNCRYDAIIIDDDLPYMDGVEAAIHLRRVSHVNKTTPVLIVTEDDSENGKLTRAQAGISADILKPLNALHFNHLIKSLLMQDRNATDGSDLDHIGLPVAGLRRSQERQEVNLTSNSTVIDEQVLDRLAQDTNINICKEMVDMFIGESLISLGEISKCCVAGDWSAILEHSHSLRSACRTFGCEALYAITLQLEEESRKNNMGECIRLASVLPTVFLQSQQNLYDYCSLYSRRS